MLKCILYPNAKLFVTSGGKSQSAGIVRDKMQDLLRMVPAFEKEIDRRRGKTLEGRDYCQYVFKNGSSFDNLTAGEKSRGKRYHSGLIEEAATVDG